VPIVMLTAKAAEEDRVAGLRMGADDYLVKPFSPRELVARVEAVLRRARGGAGDAGLSFDHGRLVIDREAREVYLDGEILALTRSEFDLLHTLATRPGRVWSRYELVTRVQGYDYEGYERTIDAHVKNLPPSVRSSGCGSRLAGWWSPPRSSGSQRSACCRPTGPSGPRSTACCCSAAAPPHWPRSPSACCWPAAPPRRPGR